MDIYKLNNIDIIIYLYYNENLLLRHEHRNKNDVLFRSELNAEGKSISNSLLKNYLNFLNIDKVYCSPFIRAMETVTPFIKEYKKQSTIRVDYSIAEFIEHPLFKDNCNFKLNEDDYFTFPINKHYVSLIKQISCIIKKHKKN